MNRRSNSILVGAAVSAFASLANVALADTDMVSSPDGLTSTRIDAAGFDFIRRVPTAWDETRFLSGEPGRDIVLARRFGPTWYIGAMTDEESRTETVPLSFLPAGKHNATIWEDGATLSDTRRSKRTVTSRDVLTLRLSSGGGAVVAIDQ